MYVCMRNLLLPGCIMKHRGQCCWAVCQLTTQHICQHHDMCIRVTTQESLQGVALQQCYMEPSLHPTLTQADTCHKGFVVVY